MRQFVRVLPTSEFDSWVSKQRKAAGGGGGGGGQAAAPNGEQLFTSAGCAGCHTLKAAGSTAKVGPDLGKLANADAAFIRTSIIDPSAQVEKGFQDGVMPQDFKTKLSKEEIDALVKYLLESQE
jgi:cytochrome c oxidase subunit 2